MLRHTDAVVFDFKPVGSTVLVKPDAHCGNIALGMGCIEVTGICRIRDQFPQGDSWIVAIKLSSTKRFHHGVDFRDFQGCVNRGPALGLDE